MEQQATPVSIQSLSISRDEPSNSPLTETLIHHTAKAGDRLGLQSRKVDVSSGEQAFGVETAQQETPWLQEKKTAIQSPATTTINVTLLDLPPEILIHILLCLPFTSVVMCQEVNRHLQILISESAEVQYHIYLGISGLLDNPRCDLPVSERLRRLRMRERRWEDVDFNFNRIIDVPFQFPYYNTRLITGFFSGIAANEVLHYMQIPSAPDWEVKWRRVSASQTIVSTGTCVYDQDLHVLITAEPRIIDTVIAGPAIVYEVRVHLNQLSTGKPHPEARLATISFETHEDFGEPHVFVEHAGHNLLLVLRDSVDIQRPDEQVYVYDWRTGELRLRLSAPFRSYGYPLILTKHTFLLTNAKTGELEYWRLPQSSSEPIQHQPFFVLSLPQLASDKTFLYISCRAEPNPDTQSHNVSKPFYNDPHEAIVTFIVGIQTTEFVIHYTLFVHRSSLAGCPNRFSSFMSPDGRPKPVSYDEWGPPACRWFKANFFQAKWFETTSGQRCIASPRNIATAPMTLLDFNPIGVAIALAPENTSTKEIETHDQHRESQLQAKTVVQSTDPLDDLHGCFGNTVYSSLPYTMRTSQNKYSFHALLLDEESVLGIREDGEGCVKEIHVLHYG